MCACVNVVGDTNTGGQHCHTHTHPAQADTAQGKPQAGYNRHLHLLPLPVQQVDVTKQPHGPGSVQKDVASGDVA